MNVQFHSMNVALACELGANAALLFENILFWVEKNRVNDKGLYDGRYWTYNSRQAIKVLFPYMTQDQLRTAFDKLKDNDFILISKNKRGGSDRTLWYAITDKGYAFIKESRMKHDLPYQHVNVSFATKYGVSAAVLLENIIYWTKYNKDNHTNYYDDYYWTYNTLQALNGLFPYISKRSISASLHKLEDLGFIKIGNYNSNPLDKTPWYTVTEKGVKVFQDAEGYPVDENAENALFSTRVQKSQIESAKIPNRECKNPKSRVQKSQMEDAKIPNAFLYSDTLQDTLQDTLTTYSLHACVCENVGDSQRRLIRGIVDAAIHRDLRLSEISIMTRWQEMGVNLEILREAFLDNEFRNENLTLSHVDETLHSWEEQGVTNVIQARNIRLNNHCQNLIDFASDFSEDKSSKIMATAGPISLKACRDVINAEYRSAIANGRFQDLFDELSSAVRLYPDVFSYLDQKVCRIIRELVNRESRPDIRAELTRIWEAFPKDTRELVEKDNDYSGRKVIL